MTKGELVANGVRLVFSLHGESPDTIVLVGPIGAPGDAWLPFQVPALVEDGYRVLTFNPRGVPPSQVPDPPYSIVQMAADAAALIDALDIGPVTMIGYSMGALVAQELGLARPDLLRGVALLGTLGRKDVMRRALFDASLDSLRSGHRCPPKLGAVTRALQLFAPTRLDDDRWAQAYLRLTRALSDSDANTRTGLLGQQEATTAYDDRLDALRGMTVRTLVVAFELDLLVPAKLTREVAEVIPGARYVEVAGCGHGGPWECPELVNPVLLEFLGELSRS